MRGTYDLAKTAAELLNIPVTVNDSNCPTMSLGWQVLAATRARDTGADLNNILNRIDQVRNKLAQFVGMNTIEFL